MKKALPYIIGLLVAYTASALGALATAVSVKGWYQTLEKPWFNPPDWIFGPVWSVLFTLMGISVALYYTKAKDNRSVGLALFGAQLFFNVAWSYLFFGFNLMGLAFLNIVLLIVAVLLTALSFAKASKWAAYLLIPYLLWISYAAILNASLWYLNG
ncbi:MAG: TspO/MBR family protein [Luteibaculaceae bacterium]